MAQEIITIEDLQKFRLQLLEDLKGSLSSLFKPKNGWEVRRLEDVGNLARYVAKFENQILTYRRIGGLIFYKHKDLIKLLDGENFSKEKGNWKVRAACSSNYFTQEWVCKVLQH